MKKTNSRTPRETDIIKINEDFFYVEEVLDESLKVIDMDGNNVEVLHKNCEYPNSDEMNSIYEKVMSEGPDLVRHRIQKRLNKTNLRDRTSSKNKDVGLTQEPHLEGDKVQAKGRVVPRRDPQKETKEESESKSGIPELLDHIMNNPDSLNETVQNYPNKSFLKKVMDHLIVISLGGWHEDDLGLVNENGYVVSDDYHLGEDGYLKEKPSHLNFDTLYQIKCFVESILKDNCLSDTKTLDRGNKTSSEAIDILSKSKNELDEIHTKLEEAYMNNKLDMIIEYENHPLRKIEKKLINLYTSSNILEDMEILEEAIEQYV